MSGRVIRLKDVVELTALSRSAIYDRMNEKSPRYDSRFPKQFTLGGKAVGWLEEDVKAWVACCVARERCERTPELSLGKQGPVDVDVNSMSRNAMRQFPKIALGKQKNPTSSPSCNALLTLGDAIVEGRDIIALIQGYLALREWTPAMAAMLASGIRAPVGGTELLEVGADFSGHPVENNSLKFFDAKKIFARWVSDDDAPPTVDPIDFINWCDEERIETVWLKIFREMLGCQDPAELDALKARVSTFIR